MCYFSWSFFLGWFGLGPTLPIGILGWDPWAVLCSHQSWALRNSRECPSQRQRCPEDPQELSNRQHCELRLPDLNPAGHAGFMACQWSCGLWRGPFALGLYPFSPPEFTPTSGVMLCQANWKPSYFPQTGHRGHGLLWNSSPSLGLLAGRSLLSTSLEFLPLEGRSLLRCDTLQPPVTPLQPLKAALRISFYYHGVNIIKSNQNRAS